MKHLILIFAASTLALCAGPYSGGTGGGSAIDEGVAAFVGDAVNPIFVGWATGVVDYSPANAQLIDSEWKNPGMALGPPSRVDTEYDIVSLGELGATDIANGVAPGSITLHFDTGISNGAGADFVVFENAFESSWVAGMVFMELAYVEVSSDGINFVRFPSISTNGSRPDDYAYWTSDLQAQIYGARDPTNVHNLAGKHVNVEDENWGTPFDLSDLINESLVIDGTVDLDNISYVRIVDIPGSGDFKDSQGNSIYDGWTTTGSGGFDLSGVGVIYAAIPEPACAAILSLMALVCAVRRRR